MLRTRTLQRKETRMDGGGHHIHFAKEALTRLFIEMLRMVARGGDINKARLSLHELKRELDHVTDQFEIIYYAVNRVAPEWEEWHEDREDDHLLSIAEDGIRFLLAARTMEGYAAAHKVKARN